MTDIRDALGAHRRSAPCEHCGAERPPHDRTCPKAKRGKTARRRGNDYERSVAARLGARRVGQYGAKVDVDDDWIAVQVKNGGAFPERIWTWLQQLPHDAQHLRAVVIGDAPGTGTKRREVIVLDFGDFCDWFGRTSIPVALTPDQWDRIEKGERP